jgi:hypothetical protein
VGFRQLLLANPPLRELRSPYILARSSKIFQRFDVGEAGFRDCLFVAIIIGEPVHMGITIALYFDSIEQDFSAI